MTTERRSENLAELVAKYRQQAEEAKRIFAENQLKMQRGEMITFTTTCGPFVPIEEKLADELEAILAQMLKLWGNPAQLPKIWRDEAAKGKAKAAKLKLSAQDIKELTEYDTAMEHCANRLEAALAQMPQLSAEEVRDIQEGLADVAAGRTKPIEQIRAELAGAQMPQPETREGGEPQVVSSNEETFRRMLRDHQEIVMRIGWCAGETFEQALGRYTQQVAVKACTEGFELAHELQPCGHSRGDCRDPKYVPGVSTECESTCIGCEREERILEALKRVLRILGTFLIDEQSTQDIVRDTVSRGWCVVNGGDWNERRDDDAALAAQRKEQP